MFRSFILLIRRHRFSLFGSYKDWSQLLVFPTYRHHQISSCRSSLPILMLHYSLLMLMLKTKMKTRIIIDESIRFTLQKNEGVLWCRLDPKCFLGLCMQESMRLLH
ncbi:hypothetical protein HanRHA438_Chr17g0797561 [Helianthus annuus]|nr:hypothetical protein HanRHA438_Chr17g0797561 [Helianthus annuus]